MNRRGFLGGILALGAAPAIVRADSLMRVIPLDAGVQTFAWDDGAAEWSGLTVSEIITRTLRARAPQLAANIARQNALLVHLKRRGAVRPWTGGLMVESPSRECMAFSQPVRLVR
jgi:hypothetical protein